MQQSPHPDWEPITAYVSDLSYFSGKMEAYLRYKEIPFMRRVVDVTVMREEILEATGLMKVPVLRLADGRWLKDTTPMIEWFESHYPAPPVIPKDPVLRFLSKLVEDYADEWCWRAALYWRWQPAESRKLLMRRIGNEVLDDCPAPISSGRSPSLYDRLSLAITISSIRAGSQSIEYIAAVPGR